MRASFIAISLSFISGAAALDLFAHQHFKLYTYTDDGDLSSDTCPEGCPTSDESSECIARGPQWWVAGECMRDGYGGSRRFSTEESSRVICEERFQDHECTEPKGDGGCVKEFPFDACTDDAEKMTRFVNFCIESDVPSAPYTVPMIKGFAADSFDECEAGIYVSDAYLPSDGDICRPLPFSFNDGTFSSSGSGSSYCEGNAMIRDIFSNPSCSSKDADMRSVPDVQSACSGSDSRGYLKTSDCETPTIFCKDFTQTDFAFSLSGQDSRTESDSRIESDSVGLPSGQDRALFQWNSLASLAALTCGLAWTFL